MSGESVYVKEHKQIIEGVSHRGTATGGAAGTLVDTDIPDIYENDSWKDERLFIFTGTGKGQTRKISGYTKATRTFTVYDNWITNPDTTSKYQVIIGTGTVGSGGGGGGGDATAANQATIIGDIGTVDTAVGGVQTDLDNAADGLGALSADIGTVNTAVGGVQDNLHNTVDGLGALSADIGTVDASVSGIQTDIGDFSSQLNLQSLLAVLGGGWDTANKDVYTALITDRLDNASYGLLAIYNRVPSVSDVVIYPVAIHAALTEITDDGSSPAYYADTESGTGTAAAPRVHWQEYMSHFEREGTVNTLSMFLEIQWQCKRTAGGEDAYTKLQVTGDGGISWVDATDDILENNVAYQAKTRIGVGLFLPTITAGTSKLGFRLISWSATGASTIAAQIRSDSYMRITYRKS